MENENSMPAQNMSAGAMGAQEMKYAGFWIRFAAFIIDGIILGVLGYFIFGSEVTQVSGGSVSVSFSGTQTLVPLLYTYLFWVFFGATPGKMLFGLKIVDAEGNKISWLKALLRMFGYFVSSLVIFIGFLWIAFDAKKQGWHDKIAKTFVVKK